MKLRKTSFQNHDAVEILTGALQMVIVTDIGPRITFFGKPGGENLLLWQEQKYYRGPWELRGGHRVWVSRPLGDESEETYLLDDSPCEVEALKTGWRIIGPPDILRIRKVLEVKVVGENRLLVDNYIRNEGNLLYSGGVWALTCTVPGPGTTYGIPLGEDNLWDYCKIVMFRSWEIHKGGYNDPQFFFGEDMFYLHPSGKENKRMIQAERGLIAMHDPGRDFLFAKKTAYDRSARYPQDCNLAFYVGPDNFMVEMETMGPEKTLKPGEEAHNTEIWVLASGTTLLDVVKLEALFC